MGTKIEIPYRIPTGAFAELMMRQIVGFAKESFVTRTRRWQILRQSRIHFRFCGGSEPLTKARAAPIVLPMIWVGTSGFQYPEWKGKFYPETLSTAKMLPYYAEHFSTTEINYSFRRIPSEKTLANWSAATPEQFRFTLKAPQEITHFRKLQDCAAVLARFCEALKTLGPKLGVVLFQLPPFLKNDNDLLKDFLATLPANLQAAFEFRHDSWFNDDTFAALKAKNIALCIADTEELQTPVVVTADYGYFRLRNPAYIKKDIAHWAKTIAGQKKNSKDTYVYFKHEETGTGPKFARQLLDELGIAKPPPGA
jgi:uncharacterized protein YecE (DUF72 family)